jgi:hypothetical protein
MNYIDFRVDVVGVTGFDSRIVAKRDYQKHT